MMKLSSAYRYIVLTFVAIVPLFLGTLFPIDVLFAQSSDRGGTAPDSGVPIPPDLPDDIDLEQCAYDLTEYMNTVLEEVGNPQWADLTSIAFNLTSQFEWPMYQMMVSYGAKFNELDTMSGNTYTRYNPDGSPLFTAYEWYDGTSGYDWKGSFGGKPMVFTEYGDFATHDLDISYYRPEHISGTEYSMQRQFQIAAGAGDKVIYFSPFAGNPEFDFHNINNTDLETIIGGGGASAGINSASQLDAGGGFAREVNALGYKYTLEIITGPDVAGVVNYINGLPAGMIPVIRSCWGDSCGMEDPLVLADFIKSVDSQVSRKWHVLVGPNEPLTDPWVSPACGSAEREREWEWEYIKCENVAEPEDGENAVEFHSLRPYPASPCPDDDYNGNKVIMCGQSVIVEESFEFSLPADTSDCTSSVNPQTLEYTDNNGETQTITTNLTTYQCDDILLQSSSEITLDFTDSELPVLGNTEDVPNGASGVNSITYEQRVNNYVSWYLQGVFPTAEEPFQSPTDPDGQKNLISFSGPIQKLMPWDVQNHLLERNCYNTWGLTGIITRICVGDRELPSIRSDKSRLLDEQTNRTPNNLTLVRGDQRHNQIVACGGGLPEACYTQENQSVTRVSDLAGSPDNLKYPYIPLSTTEDALAAVRAIESSYGQPTAGNDITEWIEFEDGRPSPYYEPYAPGETISKNFDEMYLAHARESDQLAKLLQSTYIPENFDSNSSSGMPPLEDLEILPFCTIEEETVATPGDNLYADKTREDIACNDLDGNPYPDADPDNCDDTRGEQARNIATRIEYQGLVSCEFTQNFNAAGYGNCVRPSFECTTASDCSGVINSSRTECESDPGTVVCETYPDEAGARSCASENISVPTCTVAARTAFDLETESPYLEDIFNRLVYGNMSFFRRIYPRLAANNKNLSEELQAIEVPGPEDKIKNIPGETTVGAEGTNLGSNANWTGTTTLAGDPEQGNPGSSGKLYFPYLGTIHEHFLKDVQCALRPGGLGCDNLTIEETSNTNDEINCENVPDSEIPSRYLGSYKQNFIRIAEAWTTSGESNASTCYNDAVKRSLEAGVSPAFTLAIWIHESAGSNYTASDSCWEDFGIHTAGSCQDFNSQITSFLSLWDDNSYINRYSQCFADSVRLNSNLSTDLMIAMDIFWYGARNCLDRENELHSEYEGMTQHEYYWQRIAPWFSEISGCSFDSLSYPPGGSC